MIVELNRNIIIKQQGYLSESKQFIQVGASYSECGRSNVTCFSQDIWNLLRNTRTPSVTAYHSTPTSLTRSEFDDYNQRRLY
jgi:hypothetical protein